MLKQTQLFLHIEIKQMINNDRPLILNQSALYRYDAEVVGRDKKVS